MLQCGISEVQRIFLIFHRLTALSPSRSITAEAAMAWLLTSQKQGLWARPPDPSHRMRRVSAALFVFAEPFRPNLQDSQR